MILANHAPRDNQAITGLGDILQHMFGKKNLIGLNNNYCNKCTDVCHTVVAENNENFM